MAEQLIRNQQVGGSNPTSSTRTKGARLGIFSRRLSPTKTPQKIKEAFGPPFLLLCRFWDSQLLARWPTNGSSYITALHRLVVSLDDVPNLRFHDLRHGFATMLLGEGIPLKVVSDMLGRSSIRITGDIYAHVLVEMQDEAIHKFGRTLGRQKAFKVTDTTRKI